MKNNPKRAYVYLLLTFFLWGSLYVVSRFVMGKIPTFTTCLLRFMIAYVTLTVMTHGKERLHIERSDYKYIVILGFLGYFISVDLQFLGTRYAGSAMASLINSLNPVTISLLGALLLKEKLTVRKVVGILASLFGVVLILGGNASVNMPGILLSLAAVAGWSVMSVMTRKAVQKYDPLLVTKRGILIALVCNIPVSLTELASGDTVATLDASSLVGLLYMGICCTGMAYALWNESLSMLEAGTCSAFYPIQPLVSTLLGILFLHEQITLSFVLGAMLILSGVLVSFAGVKQDKTA